MERHFGIPVTLAAAIHGALLFGFSKTPREPAPDPTVLCRVDEFVLTPAPEEPIVVEPTETAPTASKPRPEVPLPTSVEPPAVSGPADFEIVVPPPTLAVGDLDLKAIPPDLGREGLTDGTGRGTGRMIIDGAALDSPPRTRLQPSPLYPHQARRDGLRGEVIVEFLVDETGRVREPRVVRSNDRAFDEPTLRAVARWVFEPGRRHGRIVPFRMAVPVHFSVSDEAGFR